MIQAQALTTFTMTGAIAYQQANQFIPTFEKTHQNHQSIITGKPRVMCGREVTIIDAVQADEDEEGDPEAPEQHPPAQHVHHN